MQHASTVEPELRPAETGEDPASPTPRVESIVTEVLEILLERRLDDAGAISVGDVADRLPVSTALVGAAIEWLLEDGHATADADGLALTDSGYERALVAVRRHRLTERLLADVIGLEWWKVHHEAERWEGVMSDDVEARLLELLGDPGTCPHGNPIPGSANQPRHPDAVALTDVPIGPVHVVRITETLEGDDEALQLLQACGFVPGRDAEVKERRGGWIEVAGTVHDAALPPHVAAHTYVSPL